MDVLYIYKFKKLNKNTLNTVKRRFYYNLSKLKDIKKDNFTNKKQFFITTLENSKKIDLFLNEYLDWLDYYKIKFESISLIKKE